MRDIQLTDGRLVRVYDTGGQDASDALTVLWHHGSPQTGAPLEPLLSAAAARRIRLLSYGRPSYGGSSPNPGRNVASAAADVSQIVEALGVARLAVMGASGGGPHALACAALLPDRVVGVVCLAGLAPFTDSFDWYAGMVSDGVCGPPPRDGKRVNAMRSLPNSMRTASHRPIGRHWRGPGYRWVPTLCGPALPDPTG